MSDPVALAMPSAGRVLSGALLLLGCVLPTQSIEWAAASSEMMGEAQQAADAAVQYMNFRSLLCGGGTLSALLNAAHLPADESGNQRLFLTMDVDVAGQTKVTMAEVYKSPGAAEWKVLLPGSIKNRKSSSPEHLTSFKDRWTRISESDPLVTDGANSMTELLKSRQALLPVDNVFPELKLIQHAEVRGRDIGAEMSELARVKDTSTAAVEEAQTAIVKLESQLIQKLTVKKLALEDPTSDQSTVKAAGDEAELLDSQIKKTKDEQRRNNARAEKSGEAIKQLNIQDAQAQQQSLGRNKVEHARTYLYMVLQYQVLENSVLKTFHISVMGYKDEQGMWKLLHHEANPC